MAERCDDIGTIYKSGIVMLQSPFIVSLIELRPLVGSPPTISFSLKTRYDTIRSWSPGFISKVVYRSPVFASEHEDSLLAKNGYFEHLR